MSASGQDDANVNEKRNDSFIEQTMAETTGTPTCGDHLIQMIKRWSKVVKSNVSKKTSSLLSSKSKSKSKSKSGTGTGTGTATPGSRGSRASGSPDFIPESRKETLALGSAYLRRFDFSTLEPAVTPCNMDTSAYFDELFSPPPLQTTTSVPSKQMKLQLQNATFQRKSFAKKHLIRSKSLSHLM
eukprot:141903_1